MLWENHCVGRRGRLAVRIAEADPRGIGARHGLKSGESIVSINGEPVLDPIDYQFLTAAARLAVEVEGEGGLRAVTIQKAGDAPLGLTLATSLTDRIRTCANRCVFCFVDQMPEGMRESLYVKDDDWRLSLMTGNYITLTNLSDAEFARAIARKASPLYLSVHATDGAVRARMMGNRRAKDIVPKMRALRDAGLSFHCQIVLCPGMNDGAALDDTLETLSGLYPAARSAALVPVGLTRFRDGLAELTPYTKESAAALLSQARAWQDRLRKTIGTRFAFPADEFYCLAGEPIPDDGAYETYPQVENGVGLLRGLQVEFSAAYRLMDPADIRPRRVAVATGVSAAPFLTALLRDHPLPGVDARVLAVENRFFGHTVTVAGLITGMDLQDALAGVSADEFLIPRSMLRSEGDLFLDGVSLQSVRDTLQKPVRAVRCDGADLLDALTGVDFFPED